MTDGQKNLLIYGLIILCAIGGRLIPHMANVSIITALGIFAAVYLPARQAVAIPLLARFGSDLLIGFFAWPLMVAVYAAHLMGVVFGLWVKKSEERSKSRWLRIFSAGIGSAITFFLITNFVVLYPNYYPQNISGLISAYANGLPFLRGSIIGDVGYSVLLFGSWQLAWYIATKYNQANTTETPTTYA
jgi:hypothetical protein